MQKDEHIHEKPATDQPTPKQLVLDENIWVVYQDRNDNYWFGSNGKGLYKYDNQALTRYTKKHGLIDNTIRGIQEDQAGNLLIETPVGVCLFDGKQFSPIPIIMNGGKWILEKGDLWFNCNGNADHVYRYDGKSLIRLQLPPQDLSKLGINESEQRYDPYTVFGLDRDSEGNLWIGTVAAGAFRFNGDAFLWIGEKELSVLEDGRAPGVRSILEDGNGRFWISNCLSQYTIVEDQYQISHVSSEIDSLFQDRLPYFNSGLRDESDTLWMTTYGDGIWRFDGSEFSHIPVNNMGREVLIISIYQDNHGTIWLGTDNDGAYKQNGEKFEKFAPASS